MELNLLTSDYFNYIRHMKFLIKNQNNKERLIRLIIALLLIPVPLLFGESIWTMFAGFLGLGLLFNSLSGNCYLYRLLGINTCRIPRK